MEVPTIRPSRDADVPAIAAIYAHHVETGTASFETVAPDENEIRRRRTMLVERRYPWLVAELDGEVCGYACAGPYRTRPAYRHSVEDSVYVTRSAQRRGIGRALLDALIRACTDRGFRQMVAIIGDSAQAASIGLHRAAGVRDGGYTQEYRLQARPLAGHGVHAARARRRCAHPARTGVIPVGTRTSSGSSGNDATG